MNRWMFSSSVRQSSPVILRDSLPWWPIVELLTAGKRKEVVVEDVIWSSFRLHSTQNVFFSPPSNTWGKTLNPEERRKFQNEKLFWNVFLTGLPHIPGEIQFIDVKKQACVKFCKKKKGSGSTFFSKRNSMNDVQKRLSNDFSVLGTLSSKNPFGMPYNCNPPASERRRASSLHGCHGRCEKWTSIVACALTRSNAGRNLRCTHLPSSEEGALPGRR